MKLSIVRDEIGPQASVIPHLDQVKQPASYTGPVVFKPSVKNVKAILQRDTRWAGRIWEDEFRDLTMLEPPASASKAQKAWSWRERDTLDILDFVQMNYGIDPRPNVVQTAINLVSTRPGVSRHPLREYLDACVEAYDPDSPGVLDTWMFDFLGVADHMNGVECRALLSTVGRKWCIGAVARARLEGCKMDNVLILKGTQGTGKSTALSVLGGAYFSDSNIDLKSKDAYQSIRGCWILEFAELDSMKRSQATAIKAFLSSSKDRFRPSYGSKVIEVPRHTVFCGTTNDQEFLIDTTGNRRFWPIETTGIDVKGLEQARDDIWAEACIALENGETWHLPRDLERQYEVIRQEYVQSHPWEGLVKDYLKNKLVPVSTNHILEHAIGKEKGRWNRADQMIVSGILKDLGWTSKRMGGSRLWTNPVR